MPSANTLSPTAELKSLTRDLRVDIIRMIEAAGSGHPGGSLSVIDLLAALYTRSLKHRPKEPGWPDRDRLILSKGHGCPALYAVMAHEGYFPKSELMSLRKLGSPLQGHPDRMRLPGIEASTGSLGQGLSIALGIALAAKLDKKDYRTWCIMGDGEMQEGQVWEAAMAAPKFKLGNLTAIVDLNNGQIDGHVKEIMDLDPIEDKFKSFRWRTRVIDGHDFDQILPALEEAKKPSDVPLAILARTVKGKGVSFMENVIDWHGKAPTKEEADRAVAEIQKNG
ncbi:MAG TPA: transketolase [Elusimicrobiota bacterium]|jgi:transketolase|nr:transketolase [Elusimicrobiota bacterium]